MKVKTSTDGFEISIVPSIRYTRGFSPQVLLLVYPMFHEPVETEFMLFYGIDTYHQYNYTQDSVLTVRETYLLNHII